MELVRKGLIFIIKALKLQVFLADGVSPGFAVSSLAVNGHRVTVPCSSQKGCHLTLSTLSLCVGVGGGTIGGAE